MHFLRDRENRRKSPYIDIWYRYIDIYTYRLSFSSRKGDRGENYVGESAFIRIGSHWVTVHEWKERPIRNLRYLLRVLHALRFAPPRVASALQLFRVPWLSLASKGLRPINNMFWMTLRDFLEPGAVFRYEKRIFANFINNGDDIFVTL